MLILGAGDRTVRAALHIGDNAYPGDPRSGRAVPCAAQFGQQQGRLPAHRVWASLTGAPKRTDVSRVWAGGVSLGRDLTVGSAERLSGPRWTWPPY